MAKFSIICIIRPSRTTILNSSAASSEFGMKCNSIDHTQQHTGATGDTLELIALEGLLHEGFHRYTWRKFCNFLMDSL